MSAEHRIAIWALSAATIACMMLRPKQISEWIWAVCGAAIIVAAGLLPGAEAARAVLGGLDVYLFLAGMLTLAQTLWVEGVFDWVASMALVWSRGSEEQLFTGVYISGIVVTALLSNDGTIVLVTPAVLAIVKRVRVTAALPILYACAFVSNAASFVLPIANPTNLVIFARLPRLGAWFSAFGLAALASICVTYAALWWLLRKSLRNRFEVPPAPTLSPRARFVGILISASALLLVVSAGLGVQVGLVAAVLATVCLTVMWFVDRTTPGTVIRDVQWSIIPLVAGLFVIVHALDRSGVLEAARGFFRHASTLGSAPGALLTGGAVTLASNVLNNLPVGVLTRYSVQSPHVAPYIAHAALIGVDLGPNLSITGSLATLLWIMLLRRDGIAVTPWQFLRVGAIVTIPALALSLLAVR